MLGKMEEFGGLSSDVLDQRLCMSAMYVHFFVGKHILCNRIMEHLQDIYIGNMIEIHLVLKA